MTETTTTQASPRRRTQPDGRNERTITDPARGVATETGVSALMDPIGPRLEVDRESEAAPAKSIPEQEPDWMAWEPRGFYATYGKRAFNLVLLCLVLPFALAVCLPIALVNWIQFGNLQQVLYCQPRVGRRGRTFAIYKFRTMREAPQDAYDSWSQGQDRLRVTRFGRLLRNTHLDELPQLLNILRGEMDFIGPRPEMVEIDRWACANVPGFRRRNALVPGITGYAQITQGYAGKDAAAYAKKLAGDELYRRRLSFGLDLEILLRTGVWMLRGRGWRFSPPRGSEARRAAQPKTDDQADGLSETSAA